MPLRASAVIISSEPPTEVGELLGLPTPGLRVDHGDTRQKTLHEVVQPRHRRFSQEETGPALPKVIADHSHERLPSIVSWFDDPIVASSDTLFQVPKNAINTFASVFHCQVNASKHICTGRTAEVFSEFLQWFLK
jgi:hypothetical protein